LPHYTKTPEQFKSIYADEEMSESAKQYYANCSWFDHNVGELMQYMKDQGEYKNTIFVYVNDNGWEQFPQQEFNDNHGGTKGKWGMTDLSFRSPIVFSWENQISSKVDDVSLFSSIDIAPSILSLLDIASPLSFDGSDRSNRIKGTANGFQNTIMGHVGKIRGSQNVMSKDITGFWLRDPNWFYSYNFTDDTTQLFSMKDDPLCDKNVKEDNKELCIRFQQKVLEWYKKQNPDSEIYFKG